MFVWVCSINIPLLGRESGQVTAAGSVKPSVVYTLLGDGEGSG